MLSFGLIKRAVLELINQATIAGENVPLSYNGQADFVRRIPALINQAIMKIRTTVFPERRVAELSDGEDRGDWTLFPLPADCLSLLSGGVRRKTDRGVIPENRFQLTGMSILLPASPASDGHSLPETGQALPETGSGYYIEYLAYPVQLPPDPDDSFSLEETPEVIQAAEYYAAAQLVMMEDEFSYASLMNEFESRLSSMAAPVTARVHAVRDVYGGS